MALYPEAKFVFYVPPVSLWQIRDFNAGGKLEDYLKGIYAVARIAPVLYNFSVPSAVTTDVDETVDGSHYRVHVNDLIAESINTGSQPFGLNVKEMTYDRYRQSYREAINRWSAGTTSRDPEGFTGAQVLHGR